MRTSCWAWAVVACAGAFAVGADPVPPAKPVAENWLPVPKPRAPDDRVQPLTAAPSSAFPDLVLPEWDQKDFGKAREAAFEKMCPRLLTNTALKIEATDSVPQKLLKARLQRGVFEYRGRNDWWKNGVAGPGPPFGLLFDCLKDIQATALELWAGQPKELIPWLEELVIAIKNEERYQRIRVEAGALQRFHVNYLARHRLKAEAELWKVKNINAKRAEDPAKKDDAKAKPPEGDWLTDKKLPPSLGLVHLALSQGNTFWTW